MSLRIVIDVNIWLSFCIGHLLDDLPRLISLPEIELFTCHELNAEFVEVAARPKLKKYIRKKRIEETLELLEVYAAMVTIQTRTANFQDAKDNYLLDLCDTTGSNFLITGDILLLNLFEHNQTKILPYRDFLKMYEK